MCIMSNFFNYFANAEVRMLIKLCVLKCLELGASYKRYDVLQLEYFVYFLMNDFFNVYVFIRNFFIEKLFLVIYFLLFLLSILYLFILFFMRGNYMATYKNK